MLQCHSHSFHSRAPPAWSSQHPGVVTMAGSRAAGPAAFDTTRSRSLHYAVKSVQGKRLYQEDESTVQLDLLGSRHAVDVDGQPTLVSQAAAQGVLPCAPVLHVAAVFDGHGGNAVSKHCASTMGDVLKQLLIAPWEEASRQQISGGSIDLQDPSTLLTDEHVCQVLMKSFAQVDATIPVASASEGGSTAVCALIGTDRIWAANCGDSRVVLARKDREFVSLTEDHKPERPDETERIRAAGGFVFWNGGHRVMGVLSMSRAMGDLYLKQYGVISTPDVCSIERSPDDEFLILASDGLWMTLSNEEAVHLAQECIERAHQRGADRPAAIRIATQVLVKAALQQGSSDNITVIIMDVKLPERDNQPAALPGKLQAALPPALDLSMPAEGQDEDQASPSSTADELTPTMWSGGNLLTALEQGSESGPVEDMPAAPPHSPAVQPDTEQTQAGTQPIHMEQEDAVYVPDSCVDSASTPVRQVNAFVLPELVVEPATTSPLPTLNPTLSASHGSREGGGSDMAHVLSRAYTRSTSLPHDCVSPRRHATDPGVLEDAHTCGKRSMVDSSSEDDTPGTPTKRSRTAAPLCTDVSALSPRNTGRVRRASVPLSPSGKSSVGQQEVSHVRAGIVRFISMPHHRQTATCNRGSSLLRPALDQSAERLLVAIDAPSAQAGPSSA